jgi:hypothetical protein
MALYPKERTFVDLCRTVQWLLGDLRLRLHHLLPLMSAPPPDLYTIFYILYDDQRMPFSVEIEASATVYDVKEAIVKGDPTLNGIIDAGHLKLYQVDISGSPKTRKAAIKKAIDDVNGRPLLKHTPELSEIYPSGPPEKTIHFIGRVPPLAGKSLIQGRHRV